MIVADTPYDIHRKLKGVYQDTADEPREEDSTLSYETDGGIQLVTLYVAVQLRCPQPFLWKCFCRTHASISKTAVDNYGRNYVVVNKGKPDQSLLVDYHTGASQHTTTPRNRGPRSGTRRHTILREIGISAKWAASIPN